MPGNKTGYSKIRRINLEERRTKACEYLVNLNVVSKKIEEIVAELRHEDEIDEWAIELAEDIRRLSGG